MDVKVAGSDVYIAGYAYYSGSLNTLCYWKNGTVTNLPGISSSAFATSLKGSVALGVTGTDVYVTGSVYNNIYNNTATYWKNGNTTPLTSSNDPLSSGVNGIAVSGSNVYMAGFDGGEAIYWLGGKAYPLNNGQQQYTATASG